MLYTIIPDEDIFKNKEEETEYQYDEFALKNCTLQVCKVGSAYRVDRIISTDPAAYLDKELQPGAMLNELRMNQLMNEK
ncbi:YlzJ-like protein [Natranaerovirga pectinivora]|uniref:YlzJ-like protein n=1 Tax=Natranaerovirga pectinivora TaxID=682400 RepID=A0A4R3MKV1_9FIRM|nr:YlzJ-like family protein [Natranaerovirga pectinivora]TCT15039.1 YlzJ-like protein [Natranaerovirga pectinivora]